MPESGIKIQSERNKGTVLKSATSSYSGVCDCKADDGSDFNGFCMEVKGDILSFFFPPARYFHSSVSPSWPLIFRIATSDHHHIHRR